MRESRCQRRFPLERLSRLLAQPEPLPVHEQEEVLALAHGCYESWCLRPDLRQSIEIRVAGLILLVRACLLAQQHRQGLIHARRAWRLLRSHGARRQIVPVLVELLIRSAEGCDPQAAEHWRHIGCALGVDGAGRSAAA